MLTSEDLTAYKLTHGNFRFSSRNELVKYLPVMCEMGLVEIAPSKAQPKHFSSKYSKSSLRIRAKTGYDDIGYYSSQLLSSPCILVPFDLIIQNYELNKLKPYIM
jgi:hypothetical protein